MPLLDGKDAGVGCVVNVAFELPHHLYQNKLNPED